MPGKPPPPTAVSEIIASDRNLSVVTAGPPPRRGFTRLDQADFLLAVRGSDPEFAVMHPVLALCSLPRKNPGEALQWRRQNGWWTLTVTATGDSGLPYGLPRVGT